MVRDRPAVILVELRLLDVENNYAGAPVLEGHTMSLVCTARGSPLMTFRWYKDQLLFNVSLTARNVWEVLLEDQPNRRRLSVLNVDGVTVHDGGEITIAFYPFSAHFLNWLRLFQCVKCV